MPRIMTSLYVDSNIGDDATGTGSSRKPFKTITHALEVASAGDTIKVRTGLYDEPNGEVFPITMKPDINLRGLETTIRGGSALLLIRGPDGCMYSQPIIYGGATVAGLGTPPSTISRFVTITGADRASISNFVVFTLNGYGPDVEGGGLLCDSTSPTIRGNTFGGDGHSGVVLFGTAQPQIEENRFCQSFLTVGSAREIRLFSLDWGITAYSGQPFIHQNYFRCRNGIDNTGYSCAVVTENTIVCESLGIRIQDMASPTISGNRIAGNATAGIFMNDGPSALIDHNWIADNGSGEPIEGGVVIYQNSLPDLGGGAMGGSGGNTFLNNHPYDLKNLSGNEVYALYNTWTHAIAEEIDEFDIYDDDEDPRKGMVHF